MNKEDKNRETKGRNEDKVTRSVGIQWNEGDKVVKAETGYKGPVRAQSESKQVGSNGEAVVKAFQAKWQK